MPSHHEELFATNPTPLVPMEKVGIKLEGEGSTSKIISPYVSKRGRAVEKESTTIDDRLIQQQRHSKKQRPSPTYPPEAMNVRDEQLCTAILPDMNRGMLEDMATYFLRGEGISDDEARLWGPPKWNYTKGDAFDSFDYYAATGCPNCGSSYELDQPYSYHLNPPTLLCLQCGHRACPLHTQQESESVIDRLEAPDKESIHSLYDPSSTCLYTTPFNGHKSQLPESKVEECAVYIRGSRERWDFGQTNKEWWQNRYLPRAIRLKELDRTITMIFMMSKFKAPTIKEVCEICGNDEAFFSTFQARSADEGMTIMYECVRCHHRKIFNN